MPDLPVSLIFKSVLLAACVTGAVGIVVAIISAVTSSLINNAKLELDKQLADKKLEVDKQLATAKLDLDKQLADKKFEADKLLANAKLAMDKELAESRIRAELELAREKVALDRELNFAKRRSAIAEEVLAAFYGIQKAFGAIRAPFVLAAELQKEEGVEDRIATSPGYAVIRRIRRHEQLFTTLETHRFVFGALFGKDALHPFDSIIVAHNRVQSAALQLASNAETINEPHMHESARVWRREAFSTSFEDKDQIAPLVDGAVDQIEALCRPALESRQAVEAQGRDA